MTVLNGINEVGCSVLSLKVTLLSAMPVLWIKGK